MNVKGQENIPQSAFLIVINHKSALDIPIIHKAIPKMVRFGAKAELFKVPIFSWALKKSGCLPIARRRLHSVVEVYDEAKKRFQSGDSFVLAPESTRYLGEGIGPFKSGPFILAIQAGVPIVPVVISGSEKVFPNNSWTTNLKDRPPIEVRILEPVSTEGLKIEDRNLLKEEVRKKMISVMGEI